MQPFYEQDKTKLYCNDNLEVLATLIDNSVDLLCTDPQYGISFMGKDWDKALPPIATWKECLRVLKPGAFAFIMCSPRQDVLSRQIINLDDAGFNVGFTSIYWAYAEGFPKAENIGKAVDKRQGNKREVVGHYIAPDGHWRDFQDHKPNEDIRNPDTQYGYKTSGFLPIDKGISPLEGSYGGFQPKPAVEVIIVAMKPLSEKTYVDQALKNKKGITWLDDGRIPISADDRHEYGVSGDEPSFTGNRGIYGEYSRQGYEQDTRGRFPANLLVSDDALDDGKLRKSGDYKGEGSKSGGIWQPSTGKPAGKEYSDAGSFSHYYDLDKWWAKTFPFFIVSKPSKGEKNKLIDGLESDIGHNRFDQCAICGGYIFQNPDRPSACKCEHPIRKHNKIKGNFHPTVKPLKLMTYLVTIGSRPDDVVLDPFVGSGTTAVACQIINRQCIGIDNKEEYLTIAVERLKQSVMPFE